MQQTLLDSKLRHLQTSNASNVLLRSENEILMIFIFIEGKISKNAIKRGYFVFGLVKKYQ